MSVPLNGLSDAPLGKMSARNEFSVFLDDEANSESCVGTLYRLLSCFDCC